MLPHSLKFILVVFLVALQILFNFVLYLRIPEPTPKPTPAPINETEFLKELGYLQGQIQQLKQSVFVPYQDDGEFYPFTIRDSKRLTPVQADPNFHIFDFVDTTAGRQITSKKLEFWVDGHRVDMAPCSRYAILCYKKKIISAFEYCLANTTANYFFFVEADNELCVPMQVIRDLTYRYRRYFIGTGIGFSGWIMNRTFIEDFLQIYRPPHKHANESPDPIGARLLMEKKAWTVTRQYLVSHSIKPGLGAQSLTVGRPDKKTHIVPELKHLPRCFEPKRTIWLEFPNSTQDMHGWDYFDYEDCPPDAEIFPCRPDQYVNVTYGVKDMLKPQPAKFNISDYVVKKEDLIGDATHHNMTTNTSTFIRFANKTLLKEKMTELQQKHAAMRKTP